MPTPVGHTLAGLAIWSLIEKPSSVREAFSGRCARWMLFCVIASNIPDADFIFWNGHGFTISGLYHHGATHSIGFALWLGAIAGAWIRVRGGNMAMKVFVLTSLLYATHVFMDILMIDTYYPNGIGAPALWPISDVYLIIPLMPGVSRAEPFSPSSLWAMSLEIIVYGSVFIAAVIWSRFYGSSRRG